MTSAAGAGAPCAATDAAAPIRRRRGQRRVAGEKEFAGKTVTSGHDAVLGGVLGRAATRPLMDDENHLRINYFVLTKNYGYGNHGKTDRNNNGIIQRSNVLGPHVS